MKHHILAIVVLFSLAAPVMAAELTANQISHEEMWVTGTGFNSIATVTLSTSTVIPVTPSGKDYSYEITGMYLPAGSVLKLDASPVNDDLELYVKKYWLLAWTFKNGSGISYSYNDTTDTVHVHRSIPLLPMVDGVLFQTIRVYGTTENSSVNLSVTVQQGVTADGGAFSEKVDISAIPAGDYMISATDGTNTATANITILAKPAPTPSGGGGDGTYPPGWFGTPTPTPAVTPTATPSSGVTPTPAGDRVTPTPSKPAAAGATPTASAGEGPTKKGPPGFTAVVAIAGMLAIAYMVMRRRR